MNDLEIYFKNNEPQGRMIDKPNHFLVIYDILLSKYRNNPVKLMEIGLGNGGSIQMWKNYLGPQALIYGVDIADKKDFEESQIKIIRADQGDAFFIDQIIEETPMMDIIIDDGSHKVEHQISTFKGLFPNLAPGGLYVCEDTHTSYRENYGGGYKKEGTFIEYCKNIIDALHYPEDERIPVPSVISQISSITFYRSMVVVKKIGIGGCNV